MGRNISQLSENHLVTERKKISTFSRGEAKQLARMVLALNDYHNYHLSENYQISGYIQKVLTTSLIY